MTVKAQPVIDSMARRSRRNRKGEEVRDLSIQGQHAVNRQRIEEHGGRLGETFTEPGVSAWKPGVPRPKLDAAIERLRSGASQGICIYDIDRMLRRVTDAQRIIDIAEQGFIILDADGEYDLTTPNGQEQFYNKAVAAQSFSFKLSKKLKRGFATKAALGEGKAGRYRALGFEMDGTTVREEEREPIRCAAMKALETKRWKDGSDILTEAGILTGAGNQWQPSNFATAITAPRMAGYITMGGEVKGRYVGEQILDEVVWQELLQLKRSRSSGRPPSEQYLCTKGPVRCECGNTISGRNSEGVEKYRCRRRGDAGCGKLIANREPLDKFIGRLTVARLADPRHAFQVAQIAARQAAARQPHEKELVRVVSLRQYWDKQLMSGECDEDRHSQMTKTLNARVRELESVIAEAGEPSSAEANAVIIAGSWDTWTQEERRRMIALAFTGFAVRITPAPASETDFTGRVHIMPLDSP